MIPSHQRNIRLTFGLSILLLLTTATASYTTINKLLLSFTWVDHTHEVLLGLDEIMSGLIDGETAMRGYLITRDENFLQPYQGADVRTRNALLHVQLLTQDNALQRRNIRIIKALADTEFYFMKSTIELDAEKAKNVKINAGKLGMDAIRLHVAEMKDVETRLMNIRGSSVNNQTGLTLIFVVFAFLLSFIISIYSYLKLTRNMRDMDALQERLIQKDIETQQQISVIDKHAKKIADGDYSSRVEP